MTGMLAFSATGNTRSGDSVIFADVTFAGMHAAHGFSPPYLTSSGKMGAYFRLFDSTSASGYSTYTSYEFGGQMSGSSITGGVHYEDVLGGHTNSTRSGTFVATR